MNLISSLSSPSLTVGALQYVLRHNDKFLMGLSEGQIVIYLLTRSKQGGFFGVVEPTELNKFKGILLIEPREDYVYIKGFAKDCREARNMLLHAAINTYSLTYSRVHTYRPDRRSVHRGALREVCYSNGVRTANQLIKR